MTEEGAQIIAFPGVTVQPHPQPESFEDWRCAVEQAIDDAVSEIGQAPDPDAWLARAKSLLDVLSSAVLGITPDG